MGDARFSLTDRVVVITGGAGLLGARYARALSEAGARVVVADLNLAAAHATAAECPGAIAVGVDVREPGSVANLLNVTIGEFGRVDALVNNAAVDPKFDTGQAEKHVYDFETYPLHAWNLSLSVNVTGAFLCAQAFAPALLEANGSIVNVSSIYGVGGPDQRLYREDDGSVGIKPPDYTVSKAAVVGLTLYLAAYYAGKPLRVNTLILGGVRNQQGDGFVARYSLRVPMGRMADRDEYSGALIFLLSDASSYMTGSSLVVDGGWTTW